MANIGTKIFTWFHGEFVGSDESGNKYYKEKRPVAGKRERRWVIYKDEDEASRVPASWHGWLHHSESLPPNEDITQDIKSWEKPHKPNMTGTSDAYRPPGHILSGGLRKSATGDYEPWRPKN